MSDDPFGRRVLVLAPHPDDEVVGCAALICRALARGGRVTVAFLTDGVPEADLWRRQRPKRNERVDRRFAEAQAAAALLGHAIARPLPRIPTRTLRFNLPAARDRVLALLADTAADRLWVPAFEGAHQDHDAANALAATLADRIAVWEFAEYGFAGGRPRRNRFPDPAPGDTVIDLTADEKAVKVRALELYGSEAANLAHTGTARESIRPLPRHAYDRPPHDGRLFYQRFQWVPFRHPRVDFTDPWDVARDLARFYGSVSDS